MSECFVILQDEVNCRIDGLSLVMRQKLTKKYKFIDPSKKYTPAVRLGRWDGSVPFFHPNGNTYVKLLDRVLVDLIEAGYEPELVDRRDQHPDIAFEPVDENSYSHLTWPAGHRLEGQAIVLNEHQVRSINAFLGDHQSMGEIATGAGKTVITAILSHKAEQYGRTLTVVPNKSLVVQTEEDYRNFQLNVGVYFGDKKELDKTHTIVTWQSLNAIIKQAKDSGDTSVVEKFFADISTIIVDEAHSAKANVLKEMLSGILSGVPIRWGLTGTLPEQEFDKLTLEVCIGPCVTAVAAIELQDKGILANCHVNILQYQDGVVYKDYQSELKYLTTNRDRLCTIASQIVEISKSGNTLILVDRIEAGEVLNVLLPGSTFVTGKDKTTKRKEEYKELSDSDNGILIATYGIAAVGLNIPRIFNLVLIEPGKSFVRVIQSIGRGLRIAEDKDYVQIWDITSDCKYAKRHLTTRKKFYGKAEYPYSVKKLPVAVTAA